MLEAAKSSRYQKRVSSTKSLHQSCLLNRTRNALKPRPKLRRSAKGSFKRINQTSLPQTATSFCTLLEALWKGLRKSILRNKMINLEQDFHLSFSKMSTTSSRITKMGLLSPLIITNPNHPDTKSSNRITRTTIIFWRHRLHNPYKCRAKIARPVANREMSNLCLTS